MRPCNMLVYKHDVIGKTLFILWGGTLPKQCVKTIKAAVDSAWGPQRARMSHMQSLCTAT